MPGFEVDVSDILGNATATFVYDGDSNRVKATVGGVTTAYIGNYYEWTGSTTTAKKYYYAGAQRVAMRTGSSTLNYLLGDHLGSTSITADSAGARVAELMYKAWGENRYTYLTTPTTLRFTGQRQESGLGGAEGLYFYNARWYDPTLGRFAQADTIVLGAGNPQAFNRYSYSLSNPLKYTDPSGHRPEEAESADDDPPPPITFDDENWLCINVWNIGCSGTIESNLELVQWSVGMLPYEFGNPRQWNEASLFFTDATFAVSSVGASAEIAGVLLGLQAGPFGAVVGGIGGNQFHRVVTNPIETILSTVATGTTMGADITAGNSDLRVQEGTLSLSVGEASATAVTLQSLGGAIPIGIIDAAIDGYASAYSHGNPNAPGVFSRLGVNGRTLSLGPLSITLGR